MWCIKGIKEERERGKLFAFIDSKASMSHCKEGSSYDFLFCNISRNLEFLYICMSPKIWLQPRIVAHIYNCSTQEAEQEDLEFHAFLIYI